MQLGNWGTDRLTNTFHDGLTEKMSPKQAPCVLIVEDDAGNRLLLQRVLEESGYKVVATDDGPSALHAASNNDFDAIVLDLGLPGMDGLSVLTRLQRTSRAPVLVLTGEDDGDNGSAADLAQLLPNARYVEVPGGHMSAVTKPELGIAIADFLAY